MGERVLETHRGGQVHWLGMDCPKCKYPNPKGVTYCGMCYEVFNSSAAKTYLRTVRAQNRQAELEENAPIIDIDKNFKKLDAAFDKVNWIGAGLWIKNFATTYKKPLLVVLGFCVLAPLLFLIKETATHLQAYRFEYAFPQPTRYLVGYHTTIKSWSERQGQLDTPLDDFKIDEVGNVIVQSETKTKKGPQTLSLRAEEWIQMSEGSSSVSRPIPLNHPSLAPGTVLLDAKRRVAERRITATPRLAKGAAFILPSFPIGGTRAGRQFKQIVDWVELLGDWKVRWTGQLLWTVKGQAACGPNACTHLTYQATISPELWNVPDWARGQVGHPRFEGTAQGDVLFDAGNRRIFAHNFSADGTFRVPLNDLSRIPSELRVGRRVPEFPGVIVMQLHNQIDVRRN